MTKISDHPFVSIVIPAFNEGRFIRRCLESVIAQDWPHDRMEILLVDNGSTDKTLETARELLEIAGCGRVLNKTGGTIASVRNFGWSEAKGDLIAFLDGDSVVEPSWLKVGNDLLQSAEDISCVGFAVVPPLDSASWVERAWHPISSSGKHRGTKEVNWLSSFNLILKCKYFERINGFDESLVTCEDSDLGTRLSRISRLIFSDSGRVEHLGVAVSLKEFFKKELWRGRSNLRSFLGSQNRSSEILSILVPSFYLLNGLVFFVSIFTVIVFDMGWNLFFISSITFVVLPFLMAFRAGIYYGFGKLFPTVCLYMVYLIARGIAIVPLFR